MTDDAKDPSLKVEHEMPINRPMDRPDNAANQPHPARPLPVVSHAWGQGLPDENYVAPATNRLIYIQGVTLDGGPFRPSDWAERLAGAMSSFRPAGPGGIGAFIGYSPYCVPQVINGVKCVIVSDRLREVSLLAWDFVLNFARDNQLKMTGTEPVASGRHGGSA
jgi:hypothetical protein